MGEYRSTKKILLTSVCKPIGPVVGDSKSVGYELLHGQVTRSQHIYSPRVVHKQFSLDYMAHNLQTPSVVLHYPSKKVFLRELAKGYDVIGISFVLSTSHHMITMCRLIREHSPHTKIVLGGYGTVMTDDELQPHCDAICREEGVAFMRRYLGEDELAVEEFRHPDIRSRLTLFGLPIGHTAMVFAGLGCPNGCDFCCTSHFFKTKHIKLLSTGDAIFNTMAAHQDKNPEIEFTILDEDFLLNRKRADRFLQLCRESGRTFSTFCFASVKALSQFSYDELLEMGIDGVWVGYEGKKSGYDKHHGRDIDQLICELQAHGITVLSSMILGIPYQTAAISTDEFAGLMADKPTLTQFLIYGPTPGTPFYDKVLANGLLEDDMLNDRAKYYKKCTGFSAMVKHPFMQPAEIEALQEKFYAEDFQQLGPSIFRVMDVKLSGYKAYKNHANPILRKKALSFRSKLAKFLAILPVGILGPKISFKNRLHYAKRFFEILKVTTWPQKSYALAAPLMLVAAGVTWLNRQLHLMEHPATRFHHYFGNNTLQAPKQYISSFWNGLHRRSDRAIVTYWRKTAWSFLMSFKLSPKLVLPKMDILETWLVEKNAQLYKNTWCTETRAQFQTQIESLRASLMQLSQDYSDRKQKLRTQWQSQSHLEIRELKKELRQTRRALSHKIAEVNRAFTQMRTLQNCG